MPNKMPPGTSIMRQENQVAHIRPVRVVYFLTDDIGSHSGFLAIFRDVMSNGHNQADLVDRCYQNSSLI